MIKIGLVALGALLVAGCIPVNPVTMARLATLDPMSADPAAMAARLELPDGVAVAEGTAILSLMTRNAAGEEINGTYELVPGEGGVWRLSPETQSRMRHDMARARAWERDDPDGTSGSFSAGLQPCATGDGPDMADRVSLHLQLEPGGPFMPLLNAVPTRRILEGEDLPDLPRCDT